MYPCQILEVVQEDAGFIYYCVFNMIEVRDRRVESGNLVLALVSQKVLIS